MEAAVRLIQTQAAQLQTQNQTHTGKYCGHSHTGEYCIHSDLSDDINQSAAGMEMEWVQKEGEMWGTL